MHEMFEVEVPEMYAEAIQISAQMSATMAEAVLISALAQNKLTTIEKKARLNSCLNKLSQQSDAYRVPVKPLMKEDLLSEASAWLLYN
eukprot:6460791-Amphidinium_carterae.2